MRPQLLELLLYSYSSILISLFADRSICKFSQMFSTLCWCLMVLGYQPEYTLFFFHLQPLCLVYLPVCFCLRVLGCPIVLLVRLFFITGRISCSYHLLLTSNPCVLHIVQWMNLATLLWRSRYSCFASIGHPETMCDIVSG